MRNLLLILAVFLAACGDDSAGHEHEASRQGLVGRVFDSDAFIAIVAGETEATAYVCNGEEQIVARKPTPSAGPIPVPYPNIGTVSR